MRRRWVLYGLLPVSLVSVVVAAGFTLDWWKDIPEAKDGLWTWVEALSWIMGAVGGVCAVLGLRPGQPPPEPSSPPARKRHSSLVDRETEYDHLSALLTQPQPPGVVQVTGPTGIGKSKLVSSVRLDLEAEDASLTVRPLTVTPGNPLDVRVLIGAVLGKDEAVEIPLGATRATSLRAALEQGGLVRTLILVEGAEHLARPGSSMVEAQMDEALDIIDRHPHPHRVTVVLISRDGLTSPAGRHWEQASVPVGQLLKHHFEEFVRQRGGKELKALPGPRQELLYRRLDGNPRNVQLMLAVVALSWRGLKMDTLVDTIAMIDADEMPRRLGELLLNELRDADRQVLQAVAALGTAVDADAVAEVTNGLDDAVDVSGILNRFEKHELVSSAKGLWSLTVPDADWLLPNKSSDRSRLLHRAATVLEKRLVANPRSLQDLRYHFAHLAVLLNDERYGMAVRAMAPMTEVLKRYHCNHLLLAQREAVRGNTNDDTLELVNDNDLGDAYLLAGDPVRAEAAYDRALRQAKRLGPPEVQAMVRYNFGTYYWQIGRADYAYGYYEEARKEAVELQFTAVHLPAMRGLAECNRRWHEYGTAFDRAEYVLDRAESADLLLRVARWRIETGAFGTALELIERAEGACGESPWHAAACQEARADLLLAEHRFGEAATAAAGALEKAVRTHNPVVILQARTTLCWADLFRDNWDTAKQHAEEAERYRPADSALVVLALNALLHHKDGDHGEAVRLFRQLKTEAGRRVVDKKDRGAQDMLGLALCGLGDDLDTAERLLATTDGGAWVTRRRRDHLLVELNKYTDPPGRLQPILDSLARVHSRTTE